MTGDNMNMSDREGSAIEFLRLMFEPEDHIEIRLIPANQSRWFRLADTSATAAAIKWALERNAAETKPDNVYYGVNARGAAGKRGDAAINMARWLFADFDGGATVEQAQARIREAGLPEPTIVVVSGGGVHAYWRLDQPTTDLADWTARMKGIAKAAKSDKTIHNPERIMRLPGSDNVKPDRPGRPACRAVAMTDVRYSLAAFPPVVTPAKTLPATSRGAGRLGDEAQRFLSDGIITGERRPAVFRIACDMQANGWPLEAAIDAIMSRADRIEPRLSPEDIDDLPRQIANAFKKDREPGYRAAVRSRRQVVLPVNEEPVEERLEFPVDAFPGDIREYVAQAAISVGCDPVMVGLPMLVALSAAVGETRSIQIKPGWTEPLTIWGMVVVDSGSKKSPAAKKSLGFLRILEMELAGENADRLRAHQSAMHEFEADLADWKAARRKSKGSGEPPGPPPEKPEPYCDKTIVVTDATYEALVRQLSHNQRGLLLDADELSAWIGGFDKYNKGSQGAANWLQLYDATPISYVRVSGGKIPIKRPVVSIYGGIQPRVLREVIGSQHTANGLLQRFLMAAPVPQRRKLVTPEIDAIVADIVLRIFRAIRQSTRIEDIRLSRDAFMAYNEFYDRNAERIQAANGPVAGMLAKAEATAGRLAGVLHVAKEIAVPGTPAEVEPETMVNAVQLVEFFIQQWRDLYGENVIQEEDPDSLLLDYIESHGGRVKRTAITRNVRRYSRADTLEAALAKYGKAGVVRIEFERAERGPPAEWVALVG